MRKRLVAAVAAVVVVGAGVGVYAVTRPDPKPALTAAALTAYEQAILPSLRDGGRVIEQGVKPDLGDLGSGKISGTAFADHADGFLAELERVRTAVAAVTPPSPLRPAADGFDAALARYEQAVREFKAAALTPRAGREAALAKGYATAQSADTLYDSAGAVIQRWRVRLGLGTSADFPSPSEGS